MYYCSALDYLVQFGLGEATMLLKDEEIELEQTALMAVVKNDPLLLKHLEADQIDAATKASYRLNAALEQAHNLVDGYLRSVVALPLSVEQIKNTPLRTCTASLARCFLMDDSDNSTELAEGNCDKWRSWLRDVASKRVVVFPVDTVLENTNNTVRHGCSSTGRDWSNYP